MLRDRVIPDAVEHVQPGYDVARLQANINELRRATELARRAHPVELNDFMTQLAERRRRAALEGNARR